MRGCSRENRQSRKKFPLPKDNDEKGKSPSVPRREEEGTLIDTEEEKND